MSQVNIEDFLNKHVIKVLWAVVIYFLMQLSTDFKEVKVTLQQLLINQATVDNRLQNLENSDKEQNAKIEGFTTGITEFYKTYKLETKQEKK